MARASLTKPRPKLNPSHQKSTCLRELADTGQQMSKALKRLAPIDSEEFRQAVVWEMLIEELVEWVILEMRA